MPHRLIMRAEICENVTDLVRELASAYWPIAVATAAPRNVVTLCERAKALIADRDDWESTARAAGWREEPGDTLGRVYFDTTRRNGEDESFYHAADWQEACERMKLEPQALAIQECWSVSEWLADRLEERGERVARDWGGLNIWARSNTDALQLDEIIKSIWRSTSTPPEARDGDPL
jgi:hypothetical protein